MRETRPHWPVVLLATAMASGGAQLAIAQAANSQAVVLACLRSKTGADPAIAGGRLIATAILKTIGVTLRWSCSESTKTGPELAIFIVEHAPAGLGKEAVAYSLPFYKGNASPIFVFQDRMQPFLTRDAFFGSRFLGHVLAHEIGHTLSGVDAHSATGLMRARWTYDDFAEMRTKSLPFTREYKQLVHDHISALTRRSSPSFQAVRASRRLPTTY